MKRASQESVEYKWKDWGRGYLDKTDTAGVGILRLRDGDVYPDHCHEYQDNAFFVLSGSAILWVDQREAIELRAGDYVRMEPGEYHCFQNRSGGDFVAFFLRSPYVADDTIESGWTPA
jgi:quercetin dioxygenase-like cupin family protein